MFKVSMKVLNDGGTKGVTIDITQDDKPFYSCTHKWTGIKKEDHARYYEILEKITGPVGMTDDGVGVIGPISEDEMIAFECGMTNVSKQLNAWAIEKAKKDGQETTLAEFAFKDL